MRKHTMVLLGLLVLSASCQKFAEGRQMFQDILSLRDQLATEFHEKVVDINITNGSQVTVKFENSPLNSAPHDVKQKRADEVAAFVAGHYKHPVSSVTTVFASTSGPMTISENLTGHLPPPTK